MRTAYSTIVLRYVHDIVTGEFINVGVVLFAPGQKFLGARFNSSHERLERTFLKIDHPHYCAVIRFLEKRFSEMAADIRDAPHLPDVAGVTEIARKILPPDDSSLQWSEPSGGFTDDPAKTLGEIYERFVQKYIANPERISQSHA